MLFICSRIELLVGDGDISVRIIICAVRLIAFKRGSYGSFMMEKIDVGVNGMNP